MCHTVDDSISLFRARVARNGNRYPAPDRREEPDPQKDDGEFYVGFQFIQKYVLTH